MKDWIEASANSGIDTVKKAGSGVSPNSALGTQRKALLLKR